jgi:DNA-binding LacI/PurR family transcriptional regulator
MGVTIKDVAKLAGVSISTVSLVINNQAGVRDETREKVLEAIDKLNYRPNRIARGLVKKQTNSVNVIISGPEYEHFSSPLLFEVIKGIAEIINSSDYHFMLNITTAEEEIEFIENQIDNRSCDGVILWGSRMSNEKLADICNGLVPVVIIGRYLKNKVMYSVTVNDFKGGYLAAQHLIELGHNKIGFIGNLYGISSAQDRLAGYSKALEDYEIDFDQNMIVSADFYQESGYKAMKKIIPYYSKGMSAVFAASDLMALGAIEAIIEDGLSVPDDISVVGFDNMPNANLLKIPLTTIATPIHQIGREAALKLVKLLNKEEVEQSTQFDVELVVRESTGEKRT